MLAHHPTATRLVAGIVCALLLLGCTDPIEEGTSTTTEPFVPTGPEVPAPVELAVCFDGSGSIEAPARDRVRTALVDLVSSWPVVDPATDTGAEVPGLDLRVRRVLGIDAPAEGSDGEVARVEIPPLPALPPVPDAQDPHLVEKAGQREQAEEDRVALAAEAATARDEGAAAVQEADMTATASDVIGCLEAAARVSRTGLLVVFSDLLQRGDDGDSLALSDLAELGDRQVLLVVGCATSGPCGAHLPEWESTLADAGADVESVAPEALADRLDDLSVTPA